MIECLFSRQIHFVSTYHDVAELCGGPIVSDNVSDDTYEKRSERPS